MTYEHRPVAYVSLRDASARQSTVSVLERAGWLVIPQPSTSALLGTLGSVRSYPWLEPALVIVDAPTSAAELRARLRAIGVIVPVVVVAAHGESVASDDPSVQCVERARVGEVVGALVRPRTGHYEPMEQTA